MRRHHRISGLTVATRVTSAAGAGRGRSGSNGSRYNTRLQPKRHEEGPRGVLRKAKARDIDGILALIDAHSKQLLPRERRDINRLMKNFWVIEQGGELAGCCCLEVYSRKIAEVRSLAVRSEDRYKGYGARLVRAAVNEARRRGIPQILVVTSNVPFFERLNFQSCLNEKFALFWEAPARRVRRPRAAPGRGWTARL